MNGSTKSKEIAAVSAVVIRGNQVLLVRRGRAPALGLYAFPGGRVEPDETLEQAVRRELREETGLEAGDAEPLREMRLGSEGPNEAVFALTVFVVHDATGILVAGDDAEEAGWFAIDALASLPITDSTLVIARELLGSLRS